MSRRSFAATVSKLAREHAREQREAARAHARQVVAMAKKARADYADARAQEAAELNAGVQAQLAALDGLVAASFRVNNAVSFGSLKAAKTHPGRLPFTTPYSLMASTPRPELADFVDAVRPPSKIGLLIPGAASRHERRVKLAESRFAEAAEAWDKDEAARAAQLATLRQEHEALRAEVADHDRQVDDFERSYRACHPESVASYHEMVLDRSEYPDGFPQQFRVAYVAASRQLVIEYELPGPGIVPSVAEYKYVKARDTIDEKARKPADVKERYADVVASIALRTIREVLEADQGPFVDVVVFNGFVNAVDPATGKDIRPCLISVSTSADQFRSIDLGRVNRAICLRNLGAQVSARPESVQAVRPIVEFDMVDRRFVAESDVISELESRPNLMDLNPFDFEHLVGNLFKKMGLETKQTRSSRDGGVDVVAFDTRPVLGGKVVIQAKRYRHTVGVAAVRDLYGTMINEGANKGILVTTSGYGPDAFEFAKDKPIELMQGSGLLYLLEQHGVKATIVFPDEGSAT